MGPSTAAEPPVLPASAKYASLARRVIAALIDCLLYFGIIVALATIGTEALMRSDPAAEADPAGAAQVVALLGGIFIFPAIGFLYWALLDWSPAQATLGKLITGTKVTSLEGTRLRFGYATVRSVTKLVYGVAAGFATVLVVVLSTGFIVERDGDLPAWFAVSFFVALVFLQLGSGLSLFVIPMARSPRHQAIHDQAGESLVIRR